ncbi:hypothetical protein Bbelb_045210 [Branchiostoma belcheri]|nr:hypothetical protein Bbelb_045210 [Branchiostoma belcheri]
MTNFNPIFMVVTCEVIFKMAATSTPASLPVCPSGFGWDSQLEDCIPYSLCDTAPDTSICSDLSRSTGSGVSATSDTIAESRIAENAHVCPAGFGWNQYLEDCQSCSVCDDAPNTSICSYCQTEQNHGIHHLPGWAVGIAVSVIVTACLVLAAIWYKLSKRARKGDKKLKTGIQETTKTGIQETAEVLDMVTVV